MTDLYDLPDVKETRDVELPASDAAHAMLCGGYPLPTELRYRDLVLHLESADHRIWSVEHDGRFVELLNVGAIASASELFDRLESIRERGV